MARDVGDHLYAYDHVVATRDSGMTDTPSSASQMTVDALLSWRLVVAGRLVRTMADGRLIGQAGGAPALGALLRLADEDGISQAELARRQRVEAPSMCRMVDRLERDGLVRRDRDDVDRRVIRVMITPEGRDAAAAGRRSVADLEAHAFEALTVEERQTLADLLGRLLDGLPDTGEAP
jgi:DNA-binding MarR family transcriptional regulator